MLILCRSSVSSASKPIAVCFESPHGFFFFILVCESACSRSSSLSPLAGTMQPKSSGWRAIRVASSWWSPCSLHGHGFFFSSFKLIVLVGERPSSCGLRGLCAVIVLHRFLDLTVGRMDLIVGVVGVDGVVGVVGRLLRLWIPLQKTCRKACRAWLCLVTQSPATLGMFHW